MEKPTPSSTRTVMASKPEPVPAELTVLHDMMPTLQKVAQGLITEPREKLVQAIKLLDESYDILRQAKLDLELSGGAIIYNMTLHDIDNKLIEVMALKLELEDVLQLEETAPSQPRLPAIRRGAIVTTTPIPLDECRGLMMFVNNQWVPVERAKINQQNEFFLHQFIRFSRAIGLTEMLVKERGGSIRIGFRQDCPVQALSKQDRINRAQELVNAIMSNHDRWQYSNFTIELYSADDVNKPFLVINKPWGDPLYIKGEYL